MPLATILSAVQAAAALPPPVVVANRLEPQPISAVAWTCEVSAADHLSFKLSGAFPAISVESQKNGRAFHLQTNMESPGNERFSGAFPAAMTGGILGMDHYSIAIPNPGSQISAFVLSFELFERSHSGFVSVAQFDPKSGIPTAYASGVCTTQVTR